MSYLEVSAWMLWCALAGSVGTAAVAEVLLKRRLRLHHPEFYRQVGKPGILGPPSSRFWLDLPETNWWHPSFPRREKVLGLADPELDRLVRVGQIASRIALGALCFALLIQLPAAWIISAGCSSGQFVTICP